MTGLFTLVRAGRIGITGYNFVKDNAEYTDELNNSLQERFGDASKAIQIMNTATLGQVFKAYTSIQNSDKPYVQEFKENENNLQGGVLDRAVGTFKNAVELGKDYLASGDAGKDAFEHLRSGAKSIMSFASKGVDFLSDEKTVSVISKGVERASSGTLKDGVERASSGNIKADAENVVQAVNTAKEIGAALSGAPDRAARALTLAAEMIKEETQDDAEFFPGSNLLNKFG